MKFLTPGEKIRNLRKKLNMKQYDLQGERIKRNFISMIETGERGLSRETANIICDKFNKRAKDLGIDLQVSEEYLLMSPEEEARKYCTENLLETSTIEIIDEIIKISTEYNLFDIEAHAYTLKADYFFTNRIYSKAFTYYFEALTLYGKANQRILEAYLYNKLGLCKLEELYYTEALEFFLKAYHYPVSNNDINSRKNSIYNISLCYRKLGNLEKSIEFINEYLSLCDRDMEFRNYVYANIIKANCYRDKKEFDKATEIYNNLLKSFSDSFNPLIAYVYDNLGLLYADIMDYDKAIEYIDMSQKIRTEIDIENLSKTLIDKASIYIKQNMYNEALLLIDIGIDMAKKYNDNEYELKGYYILADIYKQTKNINKLKNTYEKIFDFLKDKNNYKKLLNILGELYLIYLNENNIEKIREYAMESLKLTNSSDKI